VSVDTLSSGFGPSTTTANDNGSGDYFHHKTNSKNRPIVNNPLYFYTLDYSLLNVSYNMVRLPLTSSFLLEYSLIPEVLYYKLPKTKKS